MPLTQTRTTRRPRRCHLDCGVPIRTGQQAEHTAIPPHRHDVLDSNSWIHLVAHAGPCPDPEQMPAEDLAAARAEANEWFDRRAAQILS